MELLGEALDGEGIAQAGGTVVVLSPHQNNFDLRLLVERWEREPPGDLNEWDEAFEFALEVGESGLAFGSPTMAREDLRVPSGSYRGLLTGRGFVQRGWPGSTEPGDQWRLRLAPAAAEQAPARRLAAWQEPAAAAPSTEPTDPEWWPTSSQEARWVAGPCAEVRRYLSLQPPPVPGPCRTGVSGALDGSASALLPHLARPDRWMGRDGQHEDGRFQSGSTTTWCCSARCTRSRATSRCTGTATGTGGRHRTAA